ncbi:unnamed protein product, partial [Musa acuminata var. zebrina]
EPKPFVWKLIVWCCEKTNNEGFFFGLSLGGASDIGIPWALVVQEDRCEQSSALKMVGLQLQNDNSTDDKVGWWKEDHFNASEFSPFSRRQQSKTDPLVVQGRN